jgi:uncharacterized membrane protein YkvA (DUF1232 family)
MHGALQAFDGKYSEDNLWRKLRRVAKLAGREVVEKALCLYYAAQRPETPAWAKATVYAALGYFIVPADTVPDPTPLLGYADDLSVLTLAIATIATYIDPAVRARAHERINKWFGE